MKRPNNWTGFLFLFINSMVLSELAIADNSVLFNIEQLSSDKSPKATATIVSFRLYVVWHGEAPELKEACDRGTLKNYLSQCEQAVDGDMQNMASEICLLGLIHADPSNWTLMTCMKDKWEDFMKQVTSSHEGSCITFSERYQKQPLCSP